jgi:hypothetical protein
MRKIAFILLALMLAACGEDSQMQDLVRARLKDPDSAKFKDVVTSKDGKRACIEWNAKNSMGGYGDWQITELKKDSDKWTISEFKGYASNCGDQGFKSMDDAVDAKKAAFQKAKEILHTSRNLTDADATKEILEGNCKDLFTKYAIAADLNARWENRGNFDGKMKAMENGFRDGTGV